MNITEIFTTLPVTTSFIVLVASAAIITLFSVLFLECVKFVINQEAWKTEIINSKILLDKVLKLVTRVKETPFIRYNDKDYFIKYKLAYGKFIWENDDDDGLVVKQTGVISRWLEGSYSEEVSRYSDKQDMLEQAGSIVKMKKRLSCKISYKTLTLGVAGLDLLLILFNIAPFETTLVSGIFTLIFSVRWVSGKLAKNVEKTNTHEERITKLEEDK